MNNGGNFADLGSRNRPIGDFPLWLWAAAALLIILSIFSIWHLRRAQRQLAGLRSRLNIGRATHQALEEDLALAQRVRAIVSDPTSMCFTLQAKSAPLLHAFWHPTLGIFIYADGVAAPPSGRVFQLRFIPKDKKARGIPSSIFLPDAAGKITLVVSRPPASIESTGALAISEELIAGSRQPRLAIIWKGKIRAVREFVRRLNE
jgi:hypothetical protein